MKKHLSVYGIGPVYVISISVLTCLALLLDHFQILPGFHTLFWNKYGKIVAVFCILSGAVFWFNAVVIMQLGKHIRENQLVTTGVYAWVRNPIYTALMLIMCGLIFWNGNLCLIPLCLFYYGLMTVLVKFTEEKWLADLYGKAYLDYCRCVNRCIPWVPRKVQKEDDNA